MLAIKTASLDVDIKLKLEFNKYYVKNYFAYQAMI